MSEIVPDELINDILQLLSRVKETGKIRRGTNEVTKCIERGKAKLVLIGGDVTPPEITRHIPILAKEKNIAYLAIPSSAQLGTAAGLEVGAASVAIQEAGSMEADLNSIVERVKQFN